MKHIIGGGASDSSYQKKKGVVESMSKDDSLFIQTYGKQIREANRTKFGESKGGLYRRVAVIPKDIVDAIEQIDPETFKDKKKLERFLVEFPIFKGADKI